MQTYAVIDFETTGLGAGYDRIIEIGAVLVREGAVVDTFSELMDPGIRIPSVITALTGITNGMIRGKPRPEAVMPRLRRFLGDHHCVAHNASFDRRFFTAEMALAGEAHDRPFLCSMLLSRRVVPDVASHKLGTLVHHFGLECPAGMQAHRALADALMTVALWQRLMAELRCRLSGCAVDAERLAEICRKPKAAMPAYFASLAASVAEGA